jgi:metal-responsive CopG/Arc/MetJ family transcriptional regulator
VNGRTVPVQIRLPVELVNTIDKYIQERRYSSRADFVRQKTIQAIEHNNLVHDIDVICAEILDENGKANGVLKRQVRAILKELLTESLQK